MSDWLKHYGYIFDEAGFPDKYSCLMIIIRTPLQVVHSNFCSWTSEDFSDSTDVFDYLTISFDDVSVSLFFESRICLSPTKRTVLYQLLKLAPLMMHLIGTKPYFNQLFGFASGSGPIVLAVK